MMNYLCVLRKSVLKALWSFKFMMIIWLTTLVLTLIVALPLKAGFNSVFGKSLITERFNEGFDAGVIADMGTAFRQLFSMTSLGGLLLVITGILLFTFFAGGLFKSFTSEYVTLKISDLFKASARFFLPFLGLGFLMALIITVWGILIVSVPAGVILAISSDLSSAGRLAMKLYIVCGLGMPVWFIVADNARRWMVTSDSSAVFSALKAGFASLGRKFFISYFSVLTIFVVNLLVFSLTLWITATSLPVTGLMIFLFFVSTQALFVLKIFVKAWRFAAITELVKRPGE